MVCAGLPGFAQQAMYRMFDTKSPSIFTFSQEYEDLVRLFRKNTLGGICNVYHRHVTTRDEPDAAYAAKYNTKGMQLITFCSQLHTFTQYVELYCALL